MGALSAGWVSAPAHAAIEARGLGGTAGPNDSFYAVGIANYTSSARDFGVARFDETTDLDSDFGEGGRTRFTFGTGIDEAHAAAVQPNGRVVVGGTSLPSSSGGSQDFATVRYRSDGTIDGGFGANGSVTTDFGTLDAVNSIVIQPDGKVVVAGTGHSGAAGYNFTAARYNKDGSPDDGTVNDSTPSDQFGSAGGKVSLDIGSYTNDQVYGIAIRPADGKLVLAGKSNGNFAVVQLTPTGAPDTSFSGDGKVTTDITTGQNDEIRAMALQPDGKIVVTGLTTISGSDTDIATARYNPDGSLDDGTVADTSAFDRFGAVGAGGKVITRYASRADAGYALALNPVTGGIYVGGVYRPSSSSTPSSLVAAYHSDGTTDTGFSGDGLAEVQYNFSSLVLDSSIAGLAVQSDGDVVATGYTYGNSDVKSGITNIRLSPTGAVLMKGRVLWDGVSIENSTTIRSPETPELLEPVDGALRGAGTRRFTWSDTRNARSYELWVDGLLKETTDATSATVLVGTAGTHTWKVVAKNPAGSNESVVGDFVVSTSEAQKFRPILRFDTSEKWRPLSIDALLDEGTHQVCLNISNGGDDCEPVSSWADVASTIATEEWAEADTYLDIDGELVAITPFVDYDPSEYHTPDSCRGDLYDCNSGTNSTSYYHHTSNGAYDYHDYWFFYRFNHFDPVSSHEGDWESVRLASPTTDTSKIAFAVFSAHEHQWRYLRDVLECGGTEAAAPQPCKDGEAGRERVNVYVANSSHAAYPQACSASFLPTCNQTTETGSGNRPEKGADGAEYWGNNDNPAGLEELDTTPTPWTWWTGRWGKDIPGQAEPQTPPEPPKQVRAPDGPGAKEGGDRLRYPWRSDLCTSRDSNEDCAAAGFDGPSEATVGDPAAYTATAGGDVEYAWNVQSGSPPGPAEDDDPYLWTPGTNVLTHTFPTAGTYTVSLRVTDSDGYAVVHSQEVEVSTALALRQRATGNPPTICNAWAGPMTNFSACDPAALTRATRDGSLGESGSIRLQGVPGSVTGSAPGIAQAVGPPLKPGAKVTVTRLQGNEELQSRVRGKTARDGVELVAFKADDFTSSKATIKVGTTANGEPLVRATDSRGRVHSPDSITRLP